MRTAAARARQRLLGLAFFVVVALFLAVTIGQFNKAFARVVTISLVTDSAGNSLSNGADVKLRGLIVGEVRSASTEGGRVTSTLAIDRNKAAMIPANVTARLLPKTLFGERYVALIAPEDVRVAVPLAAGATIYQDTSGNALEIGEVLDSLLPLLQAVPPQHLASTLGALSQGLSGRGAKLGITFDNLNVIFANLQPEMPTLRDDLAKLALVSQTYADAAPQLIEALDNFRTTGQTVIDKSSDLVSLYASLNNSGRTTADFLDMNASSIITFSADSREALQILARYSPVFGCAAAGFAVTAPNALKVVAPDDPFPGVRANISFTNPKGRYLPGQDEPRLLDNRGPACYDGYKEPGIPFPSYPGGVSSNDGSFQPPGRNPGSTAPLEFFPAPYGVPDVVPGWKEPAIPVVYAGSTPETDTLAVVYAAATGMEPEDVAEWTTSVGAPAIEGAEVGFR